MHFLILKDIDDFTYIIKCMLNNCTYPIILILTLICISFQWYFKMCFLCNSWPSNSIVQNIHFSYHGPFLLNLSSVNFTYPADPSTSNITECAPINAL